MIRTLIVDEQRINATVLASVLGEEPDVEVVGVATSAEEAIEMLENCDIVVVSTSIAEESAIALCQASVMADQASKTLIMGIPESEEVILRFIEAGASGFVLKDDSIEGLLDTMRAVYVDEAILPPNLAARLMNRVAELARAYEDVGGDGQMVEELTRREQEVLDLISEGKTNQEIADSLIIELGTVKNHVHNILKKLNVNSRREAAMVAQLNTSRPSLSMEA